MDTNFRILVLVFGLLSIFSSSIAQEPLLVRFENNSSQVDVMEGDEIHMRCHINRGGLFISNNKVHMKYVHPVSEKKTILTNSGQLVEAKPEFYAVKIVPNPDNMNDVVVEFTIKKVRREDDGLFECYVESTQEGKASAHKELIVQMPMTSLSLKVSDFAAVEEIVKEPVAMDAGSYSVVCVSMGSNPATENVELYFNGMKFANVTSETILKSTDNDERMFSTSVSTAVDIMVSERAHEIACQATDPLGNSKSAGISIKVNTYDPVISCNDTEAYFGQANPVLVCTVNHTGIDVTGYKFQIGESGEIIRQGQNHHKNIVVDVTEVSDGVSVVSLDLHKAEDEYLDKNYYILIDIKGGHTSKDSVRLNKVAETKGPGDAGTTLLPTAVVYLMAMTAAYFWSL